MNLGANLLYWKKFYWKMFSSAVIAGGGAVMAGLSGVDWSTMTRTQHILFVIGVVVVVVKTQDALVDQTFTNLSNNTNGQKPSNGNDVAAPVTTSSPH